LKRVVVVDDEPNICRLVQMHLERAGYSVETAFHGADALDSIRRDPPDLIIADAVMPEIDGIVLLSILRRDPVLQDLPFLLVRNSAPGADAPPENADSAVPFLVKPFRPTELIAAVRRLLGEEGRGTGGAPVPAPIAPLSPSPGAKERPKNRRDWWEA
jgi:two-component system response regulator BaeR